MSEQNTPLQEFGKVPSTPPALTVSGAQVEHYTLDWQTKEGHQSLGSDEELPTQEVSAPDGLELRLSSDAKPLSLNLMVFAGSVASVDPTIQPVLSVQCSSSSTECAVETEGDSLVVRVRDEKLPKRGVVSLFAEYYRGSDVKTDSGSTNLVGWVFNYTSS